MSAASKRTENCVDWPAARATCCPDWNERKTAGRAGRIERRQRRACDLADVGDSEDARDGLARRWSCRNRRSAPSLSGSAAQGHVDLGRQSRGNRAGERVLAHVAIVAQAAGHQVVEVPAPTVVEMLAPSELLGEAVSSTPPLVFHSSSTASRFVPNGRAGELKGDVAARPC